MFTMIDVQDYEESDEHLHTVTQSIFDTLEELYEHNQIR